MRRSLAFVLVLVLVLSFSPVHRVRADAVDDVVTARMATVPIPGISIAVVRDGRLVRAQGFGLANLELNAPATAETVYNVASITKQFTAAAILMLVEEGKLGLDDKLRKYVDGLPESWDRITVRHMLTHTAGLKEYLSAEGFSFRAEYTPARVVKFIADAPLDFQPGEAWSYSNGGWFLLGLIVEKVSGKTYGEFVAERIFRPLGMDATRLDDPEAIIKNRASGYVRRDGALRKVAYTSATPAFSAGGLITSASDLARWAIALDTGKVLRPESRDALWSPVVLETGRTYEYGLGWYVSSYGGHRYAGHPGVYPGYLAHISRFPDDKLTVVVMMNLGAGPRLDAAALARDIAATYVPELSFKSASETADPRPEETAALQRLLTSIIEGQPDQSRLASEFLAILGTDRWSGARRGLRSSGPIRSFAHLATEAVENVRRRRYRVAFGGMVAHVTFVLTPEDKLAFLIVERE